MDVTINNIKKELREKMKALNKIQTQKDLLLESNLLNEKLVTHPLWKKAKTVLLFSSLPDEPNTSSLMLITSKRILLPVVQEKNLILKTYTNTAALSIKNKYGIKEPEGDEFDKYDEIDLAIIPGVAFDNYANRLGRGKGYYDKLLTKLKCKKIGICFQHQLIEEVPIEKHDIILDEIIVVR